MANRLPIITSTTELAQSRFSKYLREKLEESDISMRQFARAIGVGKSSISAYINGIAYPRLDTLALIYAYFGEEEIKISVKGDK